MPVLPFPHYIKGFIFDEDELYISAYYAHGQPITRFDYEWWELAIVDEFLELPFVSYWSQLDETREAENLEELMQLPYFEATDDDILGIPEEDWDKEYEEEEERNKDASLGRRG